MSTSSSSEERKNLTAEQMRQAKRGQFLHMIEGLLGMGLTVVLGSIVMIGAIRLHPKDMTADKLKGYALRIEYAFRYQTLQVLWLLFNVWATMFGRFKTNAVNPLLATTEQRVQGYKNTLTNSLESAIISVLAQLIFVSYAESKTILWFIPFVNIVQFLGRIAYFLGYPTNRTFGFTFTLSTNAFMTGYNVYKFGSFLGFYQ